MNSCLWDVNRRGPTFKEIYEENLNKLVDDMKNKFSNTQFYWMTTPPSNFDFNKEGIIAEKHFFDAFPRSRRPLYKRFIYLFTFFSLAGNRI